MRNKIAIRLGLAVLSFVGAGAASAEPWRLRPTVVGDLLPPYEIATIVRSAGLDPVSRPMLQGRRYVLRAIDPDGIDVRVLVDARFGEIVAVRPLGYDRGLAPRVLAAPSYERGPRIVAVPRDEGWIEGDDIVPPRPPRVVPAPGMNAPAPGPAPAPLASRAPEAGAVPMRAPLPRARPAPVKSAKAAAPAASKPADASEHTGSIRVPAEVPKAEAPKAEGTVAAKNDPVPAAAAAAPAATDGVAAAKPDTTPAPAAAAPTPASPAMPPVAPLEE